MHWLKMIPGFRSGTRWKQIIAVVGYLAIGALMATDAFGAVLGLIALMWIAVAANFLGVRDRLPLFSDERRGQQITGWFALLVGSFAALLIGVGLFVESPSEDEAPTVDTAMQPLADLDDERSELVASDNERDGGQSQMAEEAVATADDTTDIATATATVEPPTDPPPTATQEPTPRPPSPTPIPPTATLQPTAVPPTSTPAPPTDVPPPPPPTEPPEPVVSVVIGAVYYDGAVTRTEDDEYIEIVNQGSAVNLGGWSLSDSDDNRFNFPGFDMAPGQRCRVYTNENHPEHCGFSFGSTKAIWGNSGDTAFLRDPSGAVVSQKGW